MRTLLDASPGSALHLVLGAGPGGPPGRYLERLRASAAEAPCALHAYALMGSHVHLLVTALRPGGATRLARALGEASLWPVHARRYLLACMRYIELNPVRAGLAARPGEYPWSSYRANALGAQDALLTPHALYCALGRTPEARRAAWRAFVRRASRSGT